MGIVGVGGLGFRVSGFWQFRGERFGGWGLQGFRVWWRLRGFGFGGFYGFGSLGVCCWAVLGFRRLGV